MSGTITTIDTPLVGTNGTSSTGAGSDGTNGESETQNAAPFSNQDFTSLLPLLTGALEPDVIGGAGGGGSQGARGDNGTSTTVSDPNDDMTTTWTQGTPGGPGGDGGDATLQMQDDTVGSASAAATGVFTLYAGTRGGIGGNGDVGGQGGNGGDNAHSMGSNPSTGAPTNDITTGAAGGAGGDGGGGGAGGTANTTISGLDSYCADGTTISIDSVGAEGGQGAMGMGGAIGGETSAGGLGGDGGAGGAGTGTLSNAILADNFEVSVSIYGIGGAGGDGGLGGGGGESETFTSLAEPSATLSTANGSAGGDGGSGGAASAELTGSSLTAPLVLVYLYALEGSGGAGGTGGSGGAGVSTPTTTFENGTQGATGSTGTVGAGVLTFTGNTITVGTPIPGAPNFSHLNELSLTLEVAPLTAGNAAPVALNGGPGGNLVFSGNDLVGTGNSTLDLSIAGTGSVTIDTVHDTLSIDNSPANSMVGFDSFTLDNNDVFVAGAGNYVVAYASDPDTLVYAPTSGNVTLEGVTSANLLLDFQGFGASLDALTLAGDTTTLDGNTFIDVNGHATIELAGFTGAIPTGDVQFEAACFAAGTRIATARGAVAVESLAVGDVVRTHFAGAAPVIWIGHRRVDCRRHPKPAEVWPVRVAAGAFGDGQPARDLDLSPDHAVYVDGALVPIRYLVNGATIAQQPRDSVHYFHVELAAHDVLLAEGLPCESYLDTGNRAAFANGGGVAQMQPDFALVAWATKSCAPLVLDGPAVTAARSRLLDRATRLGHALTQDAGLRVLADGRPVPAEVDGPQWRVRLPEATARVRLVSRVCIPAHTRPGDTDTRPLGVAIAGLALDGCAVGLDGPRLAAGWHAPEPHWRWTAGDATLAVDGARELAFAVVIAGTYWRGQAPGDVRAA
jgi:hypothetical protein